MGIDDVEHIDDDDETVQRMINLDAPRTHRFHSFANKQQFHSLQSHKSFSGVLPDFNNQLLDDQHGTIN